MKGLYEDNQFWEEKWAREESLDDEEAEENSWIEGQSGEDFFDKIVLDAAKGMAVIDIGCGWGEFTLSVARVATKIVGIDFSQNAISKALAKAEAFHAGNFEFKLADARKVPFPNESFDLSFSRRGPAMDSLLFIAEVYRILRRGGRIIQQEIGERDKLNWKKVFGRGQNFPFKETIAKEKKRLLAKAGFKNIDLREFEAKEYFKTLKDAVMRLETTPIIPSFDKNNDRASLKKLEELYTDKKGIKTTIHRVIITATKD